MKAARSFSAALCAALGVAAALPPGEAEARSPVALEGVDHDTREAILDLLPNAGPPATLFDAERLSEEAAARATAWLRSEGYYAAQVTPQANDNPPSARLVISLGQRFRFDTPTLVFDGANPSPLAMHAVEEAMHRIAEGDPARAAAVLEAEGAMITALQNAGYADATAGDRQVIVDHATNVVTVHYVIRAGDFARLGEIRADPNRVYRASFVNSLRNWAPGDAYTPDHLARLRRDFNSTGDVAQVSTQLQPPGDNGLRDVVVHVEPAKRNAYELGFGYSTTEGAGIDAQWTRRNITGRADSLTLSTVGSPGTELEFAL